MALCAFSGAAAIADNSFFTHLATGQRMLDGSFPSTDPYSYTAHGHPWVIQSWFASLLYGLGYRVGHGVGIRVLVAALSGVLGALLWRLTRPARMLPARLLAVLPAVVVGYVAWGPRPLLFGLVCFTLVLVVLREERDPRWLVPVMWIWVNTHGSFPLAGVLVGAYALGVRADGGNPRHALRTLWWVCVGMALGAVNPVGPKLLWFPIELLRKQPVLKNMIEWQAPTFVDTWQRVFLLAFLASMALVPRVRGGERYRMLFPTLIFCGLAFTAMRNIVLASVLLVPLLALGIGRLGTISTRVRSRLSTVGCVGVAALMVVATGLRLEGPSFDFSTYPVEAVDWLHATGRLDGSHRLAHQDSVGNYLELRFLGDVPVFVDDRVDMYPQSVIADELTLFVGGASWHEVLDRWNVDTVLWDQSLALSARLKSSPDWRLVKVFPTRDTTWLVFERVRRDRA